MQHASIPFCASVTLFFGIPSTLPRRSLAKVWQVSALDVAAYRDGIDEENNIDVEQQASMPEIVLTPRGQHPEFEALEEHLMPFKLAASGTPLADMRRNWFNILQVDPKVATLDACRSAMRRMSRAVHPDKNM